MDAANMATNASYKLTARLSTTRSLDINVGPRTALKPLQTYKARPENLLNWVERLVAYKSAGNCCET